MHPSLLMRPNLFGDAKIHIQPCKGLLIRCVGPVQSGRHQTHRDILGAHDVYNPGHCLKLDRSVPANKSYVTFAACENMSQPLAQFLPLYRLPIYA